MKKKLIIILAVIAAVLLLIPVRKVYEDGGHEADRGGCVSCLESRMRRGSSPGTAWGSVGKCWRIK